AGIDYCRENPFDSACQPVMPTTDAGQFDYSSGGGGGGGGGGPSIPPKPIVVSECNYELALTDPDRWETDSLKYCQRKLNSDERLRLSEAQAALRRLPHEFTDSIAREECGRLSAWVDSLVAGTDTLIGVGKSDSSSTNHLGQGGILTGYGHVDPRLFANLRSGANLKPVTDTA